jgi:hypothetical protein
LKADNYFAGQFLSGFFIFILDFKSPHMV